MDLNPDNMNRYITYVPRQPIAASYARFVSLGALEI
jgi:hypothetical protein